MEVMELEVGGPRGRTVLTGVLVHGEEVFIPTTLAPLKRWDHAIDGDPRARLRVGEEVFEGALEPVADSDLNKQLFSQAQVKYGRSLYFADWAEELTRFFRWVAVAEAR
jgi:hypothetical protein